ncbi:hypothetical protein AAE02nite_24250 [Adhaeribacter aerolatus]|uniref:Glucose/Sorbosone dehydrogenase domain-containing protein n=1 Tax=Adhaeribacter aerolatus TaxID=670289 RepID=A0A512AYH0_9BACT|nr:hypothetical protein [Adhaeribacter aerolatus]GEO04761.1 hypothetical protein AAE02nite_24250 [Adhaeribacter aerolatus]
MKKPDFELLPLEVPVKPSLEAKSYFSGFEQAHDTYNAISAASDGKIYYVLSSDSYEVGGQMYVYDPINDKTEFIADLTEVCGEKDAKAIPQGKSHVRFYEREGKLYFATHVGYYQLISGMDRLPETPPPGYQLYPGGHFLSFDLTTYTFEDLAIVPNGEGVVSMTMDRERGHLYGITWPTGNFINYDIAANKLTNLGPCSAKGEAGTPGSDFRSLCRSLFVDPKDGAVYFSTAEGDIFNYKPGSAAIKKVTDIDLRLDYFGQYDPTMPGSMGYNWRKIFWHPTEEVAYGVHGNSGYLFRFDPRQQTLELLERITSEPSKKSGMYDQFSYGYLGFQLGPDLQTIYYLTGGPIFINGKRLKGKDKIAKGAAKGLENLHLITFNLPRQEYVDHGPIFYEDGNRPTYVNSIAVSTDGNIYTLARFECNGRVIQDLVKMADPLAKVAEPLI